jgi:hypothetical protein
VKQVPDLLPIRDMLDLVEEGKLAIPEFQRPFVWRPPQVADLLVSVARRWPIGTLLLLEGPQDFAVRPLAEAPELTEAKLLVLDGQQRATALYRALGHHVADEVYFVDFNVLLQDGELSDEHIQVRRKSTFFRQFPDMANRARSGVALVHEVADLNRWHEWITQETQDKSRTGELSAIRNEQLGGLTDYSIPSVRLERSIGFDALAKIFETINRTGIRLATFDLMVARMYPRAFDLRGEWEAAEDANPLFAKFEVDGMDILRLIALREFLRGSSRRVKGIRQGDVLQLDAEVVKSDWPWAVKAYAAALDLVRDRCGVVNAVLLPSSTMLLPIAVVLLGPAVGDLEEVPDEPSEDRADLAERFFWAAGIAQAYAQGANTRAVRDARELQVALAEEALPEVIQRVEVDASALQDDRRRNESLLRTATALLVRDGACDWLTGARLEDVPDALEFVQIFPRDWLRARGSAADGLVNWSLQQKETAKLFGGLPPSGVAEKYSLDEATVATQLVKLHDLEADDWGGLLDFRVKELRNHLEELVSSLRAGPPISHR